MWENRSGWNQKIVAAPCRRRALVSINTTLTCAFFLTLFLRKKPPTGGSIVSRDQQRYRSDNNVTLLRVVKWRGEKEVGARNNKLACVPDDWWRRQCFKIRYISEKTDELNGESKTQMAFRHDYGANRCITRLMLLLRLLLMHVAAARSLLNTLSRLLL